MTQLAAVLSQPRVLAGLAPPSQPTQPASRQHHLPCPPTPAASKPTCAVAVAAAAAARSCASRSCTSMVCVRV